MKAKKQNLDLPPLKLNVTSIALKKNATKSSMSTTSSIANGSKLKHEIASDQNMNNSGEIDFFSNINHLQTQSIILHRRADLIIDSMKELIKQLRELYKRQKTSIIDINFICFNYCKEFK